MSGYENKINLVDGAFDETQWVQMPQSTGSPSRDARQGPGCLVFRLRFTLRGGPLRRIAEAAAHR